MLSTLRAIAIGALAALAVGLTGAASAAEFHGGKSHGGGGGGREWHGGHWRGAPAGGWHGYGWGGPFVWGYDPHYNDPNYTGYDDVNNCTRFRAVYNRYGKFIGRRAVDICS
jgi:hypothetical protein